MSDISALFKKLYGLFLSFGVEGASFIFAFGLPALSKSSATSMPCWPCVALPGL